MLFRPDTQPTCRVNSKVDSVPFGKLWIDLYQWPPTRVTRILGGKGKYEFPRPVTGITLPFYVRVTEEASL
jgi:hypothetical protein